MLDTCYHTGAVLLTELNETRTKQGQKLQFKGGVNPATLSEPEFFVLFTILNVNVYFFITDINHLP